MDPKELAALLGYPSLPALDNIPEAAASLAPAAAPEGLVDPFPNVPEPQTPAPRPDAGLVDPFGGAPPGRGSIEHATSEGRKAFDPNIYNSLVKGPQSAVEKKMAVAKAGAEGRYSEVGNQMRDAAQSAEEAIQLQEQADFEKARIETSGNLDKAALHEANKREDLKAWEQAKLASNQAKADYRTRLLTIPQVNPDQLWDTAGTAGQFGMMISAFVHDFLGAKGIKTSAMDTINGAIKRNIDAQLANIERGMQVARGFKDLWDMERLDAASDTEARLRMQGHMLKAIDAKVAGEMGRYDSKLAQAKAQAARAQIGRELAKIEFEVQKSVDDAANQEAQRIIALNGQILQASIASADRASRERIAQMETDARKKPAELPPVIYDLTKSGQGAAKFRFKSEHAGDKQTVRDVSNKVVSTTQAIEGMRELMDLQRQIGSAPPDVVGRLRNEINRRESALRNTIVMALVLDQSGKQVTDKEREYIEKLVPANDWFTNGENFRIISQLVDLKGRELNNTLRTYTNDVTPGDPAYGTQAAQGTYGEGELIEADAVRKGTDKPTETQVDKVVQQVENRTGEALQAVKGASREDKGEWEDFRRTSNTAIDPKQRIGVPVSIDAAANAGDETVPDKGFLSMKQLADLALNGNPKAEEKLDYYASGKLANTANEKGSDKEFKRSLKTAAAIKEYAEYFKLRNEKVLREAQTGIRDNSPGPVLHPSELFAEQ